MLWWIIIYKKRTKKVLSIPPWPCVIIWTERPTEEGGLLWFNTLRSRCHSSSLASRARPTENRSRVSLFWVLGFSTVVLCSSVLPSQETRHCGGWDNSYQVNGWNIIIICSAFVIVYWCNILLSWIVENKDQKIVKLNKSVMCCGCRNLTSGSRRAAEGG